MNLRLVDVYSKANAAQVLWRLLIERDPEVNISHRRMPSYDEHVAFVESKPYQAWYLIENEDEIVGSIYLTHMREIGIFIFKEVRGKGIGTLAMAELQKLHPGRFLANIAPMNVKSQRFFIKHGFRLIQHTYEFGA